MDYIKKEENSLQDCAPRVEGKHVVYQNQQLPLSIVELIQLAAQNGITVDPQLLILKQQSEQNLPRMNEASHRNNCAFNSDDNVRNVVISEGNRINGVVLDDVNTVNDSNHRQMPVFISDHSYLRHVITSQSNNVVVKDHVDNIQHNSELPVNILVNRLNEGQMQVRLSDGQNPFVQEKSQINQVGVSDNRISCGLMQTTGGRSVSTLEMTQQNPLPLAIKSEQDADDSPYFYEQMLQAYTGNGDLHMDPMMISHVEVPFVQHSNVTQFFGGQIAHVIPSAINTQQLQSYVTQNSQMGSVGTQTEINRLKREEGMTCADKVGTNETRQRQHYNNDQWDRSENDSSAQNKLSNGENSYRNIVGENIKGEYICAICNGVFPSKRSLKQHAKNCSDENENSDKAGKFSCAQCSYKCQSPAILKIHERTHTGEKPFSCTFCDYKSGQKNNVAKHVLVHMKEKPFRCRFCDYRCAQKNNLVVHERTHTGIKPFACTLCDYKTVQKPNLVKHTYLHTGQKPYSCDVCSYRCVQKTNLTKHKLRHLNEKPGEIIDGVSNSKRGRSFKCVLCDFTCGQRLGLGKHVQDCHQTELFAAKNDENCGDVRVDSQAGYRPCQRSQTAPSISVKSERDKGNVLVIHEQVQS